MDKGTISPSVKQSVSLLNSLRKSGGPKDFISFQQQQQMQQMKQCGNKNSNNNINNNTNNNNLQNVPKYVQHISFQLGNGQDKENKSNKENGESKIPSVFQSVNSLSSSKDFQKVKFSEYLSPPKKVGQIKLYSNKKSSQKKVNPKQQIENFSLNCQKHKAAETYFNTKIEKICTNPQCEFDDVIFCQECQETMEGKQHLGLHDEFIINFDQFLQMCQQASFKHKEIYQSEQITERDFVTFINDLDKYILRYRNHIQMEEQKIEADFDILIQQFTENINELKLNMKKKLREQLSKFNEKSSSLQTEAKEIQFEKLQNHSQKNIFDEFLGNLGINSTSFVKKQYNIKKMISGINPIISKQLKSQHNNESTANNSKILIDMQSQNSGLASPKLTSSSQVSQFNSLQFGDHISQTSSLNTTAFKNAIKGNKKQQEKIFNLYEEVKNMTLNKPFYRNQGEANHTFRESQIDIKKIYNNLNLVLDGFLNYENTQVNDEMQQQLSLFKSTTKSLTQQSSTNQDLSCPIQSQISKIQAKYENQYLQQKNYESDKILNKLPNKLSAIEHQKTFNSCHNKGVTCMKIVESQDIYLTGSYDKTVKIWGLHDHKLIKTVQLSSEVTALSILPCKDKSVMYLVGLANGFSVLTQNFEVFKNYFTEQGNSDVDNADQHLLEIQQKNKVSLLPPTNQIEGLNDGQTVIVINKSYKVVVFNIFSEEHPKKYFEHRDQIYSLVVFPHQRNIATGGVDKSIKIFRCNYYKQDYRNNCLEKLVLDLSIDNAHKSDITALNVSGQFPNILFSGCQTGQIKVWDTNDGQCLRSFENSSGWVYKLLIFEQQFNEQTFAQIGQLHVQNDENLAHTGIIKRHTSPIARLGRRKTETSTSKNDKENSSQYLTLLQRQKTQQKKKQAEKNNLTQQINTISLQNLQFVTASFDGKIKLWEADKGEVLSEINNRNYADCYPFGGTQIAKINKSVQVDEDNNIIKTSQQIQLFTSGNKSDPNVNIYALK